MSSAIAHPQHLTHATWERGRFATLWLPAPSRGHGRPTSFAHSRRSSNHHRQAASMWSEYKMAAHMASGETWLRNTVYRARR